MLRTETSRVAAILTSLAVAVLAVGLVAFFYLLLEARVRAGTDNAQRLSVLLPYIGVGSGYVLARACGIGALILLGVSAVLGLEVGRLRLQHRPRGGLVRLHRQISLAALGLVAAHIALPYTSSVTPFGGLRTSLVPFDEPYSFGVRGKIYESFGIIAFYLLVLLGPTYYLLRRQRWLWSAFHPLTVAAYGLAVLHALFLGSDFVVRGPTRTALIAVQLVLTLALARRLLAGQATTGQRVATIGAFLLSVAIAGITMAGLAGASLGGLRT